MSTDKTLADVQPGGRVRLGDQAELDRHEFQAWARELLPCPFCGNGAEFVPYKDNGLTLKCKSMGCIQRNQRTLRYGIDWLRTSMAEHWNTRAISAQPSPGGQGDALGVAASEMLNLLRSIPEEDLLALDCDPHPPSSLSEAAKTLEAALAARQPVEREPAMYQVRPRKFNDGEGWRKVTKREYDDRGPFPGYDETEWERRTLYADPPAQAVDLSTLERFECQLYENPWPYSKMDEVDGGDWVRFDDVKALIDSQDSRNG